ncbi:MAG TPA: hypothetical protein PLD88_05500, partial [Candidatus Berkiella sp.]|nr:hypothetical protein [Candidatus Berkiella sp.]
MNNGPDMKIQMENAIFDGNLLKVSELVEKGLALDSSINFCDETALECAIKYGQFDIVVYLSEIMMQFDPNTEEHVREKIDHYIN